MRRKGLKTAVSCKMDEQFKKEKKLVWKGNLRFCFKKKKKTEQHLSYCRGFYRNVFLSFEKGRYISCLRHLCNLMKTCDCCLRSRACRHNAFVCSVFGDVSCLQLAYCIYRFLKIQQSKEQIYPSEVLSAFFSVQSLNKPTVVFVQKKKKADRDINQKQSAVPIMATTSKETRRKKKKDNQINRMLIAKNNVDLGYKIGWNDLLMLI